MRRGSPRCGAISALPDGAGSLSAMAISDVRLLEFLACPEDKGPLYYFADEDSLYNPRLKRRYAIKDGIPVMLIDEAESVSMSRTAAGLRRRIEAGQRELTGP